MKWLCPHCDVVVLLYNVSTTQDYQIWLCPNCNNETIFIKSRKTPNTLEGSYPRRKHKKHDAIPQDVWVDYEEALKCFDIGSHKATVAMARRALQTTCKIKGAKKQKLDEQIDEIMPQDMKDLAHEIRLWGNLGAHPDEIINDVNEQDAKDILELADTLFKYVFIMPYEVQQKRNQRTSAKPSTP